MEEKEKQSSFSIIKRDETIDSKVERRSLLEEASPATWGHSEVPAQADAEGHV